MDEQKRNLQGSSKRDIFKRKRKTYSSRLYATDIDLAWIEKYPPGIVAYVDYKGSGEGITFTEAIAYNEWVQHAKLVYIIEGPDPEQGPFDVYRYLEGDWHPDPPMIKRQHVITCPTWDALTEWEEKLRAMYRRNNGKLAA